MKYAARDKIFPCTNCGMAPMRREIAYAKLAALGTGAVLARKKFGGKSKPKKADKKAKKKSKKPAKKTAKKSKKKSRRR
jgi:hypothetical protein